MKRASYPKALHPALKKRAVQVQIAHAALLAQHGPTFNQRPAPERMRAIQAHVRGQNT